MVLSGLTTPNEWGKWWLNMVDGEQLNLIKSFARLGIFVLLLFTLWQKQSLREGWQRDQPATLLWWSGGQSICTTNAAWLVSTPPQRLYTINKPLRAEGTINKTLVLRASSVAYHFGRTWTRMFPASKSLHDSEKETTCHNSTRLQWLLKGGIKD